MCSGVEMKEKELMDALLYIVTMPVVAAGAKHIEIALAAFREI